MNYEALQPELLDAAIPVFFVETTKQQPHLNKTYLEQAFCSYMSRDALHLHLSDYGWVPHKVRENLLGETLLPLLAGRERWRSVKQRRAVENYLLKDPKRAQYFIHLANLLAQLGKLPDLMSDLITTQLKDVAQYREVATL